MESFTTPAIATGRVYVGGADTNIYALNASTGAFLWKYAQQDGDERVSSPVVANGVVYATTYDTLNGNARLRALDAKTGTLVGFLQSDTIADDASSPMVANGFVYVSTSGFYGARLYAYSVVQGGSADGVCTPSICRSRRGTTSPAATLCYVMQSDFERWRCRDPEYLPPKALGSNR